MKQSGVLLVNLGTPDAPTAGALRRYLGEFLSDPRVLDVPALGRWLIVNLGVLPFRAPRSAAAYRKVWSEQRGSPLLANTLALGDALRAELQGVPVEVGMRYGRPSLAGALDALIAAGCERVVALPLYPQYAASSTGSSVEELYRHAARPWNTPHLSIVPPFYDRPGFLDAVADVARARLAEFEPDHVLLSYHGLPERHVVKSGAPGHCLTSASCCDALVPGNAWCYRAQCFATSRGLIERLALDPERTTTVFQSRFGRTPWIQPATDVEIERLARAGVKRLAVLCPSFTADCLETVEEIGMRGRDAFRAGGGDELLLVPCVNAEPSWVAAVAELVRAELGA